MDECLEKHEVQIKDLLNGEMNADAEVIAKAKNIEITTHQQFEIKIKNIVPISPAATTQLKTELKKEISNIHNQLEKQIQDRSLTVKVEVSQLISDTVGDYKFLMNAFSIASNCGKDKFVEIHNNLKIRANHSLQKYLKLSKYSVNVKEEQRNLKTMIDVSYNALVEAMANKRTEWNQKLESCNQKAINYYKQLFNRSMGDVSNEEDLKNRHKDLKELAIALWEESFPHHYFGDIFLPECRKFAKQLDNEFETSILQKWKDINLDIDQNTRAAVEDLVKKYEENMNAYLNKFEYTFDDTILSKDKQFSKEAENALIKVNKPKNTNKKIYDDLLSNRLLGTYDCLTAQNAQKKHNIENVIFNYTNSKPCICTSVYRCF